MSETEESLNAAAMAERGLLQFLSRSALLRVTGIATNVVLARLLTPVDFGTVAVATSILNAAIFVLDSGLVAAAIRAKEPPTAGLLRALGSLQLLITIVLASIICIGAIWIARQPSYIVVALVVLPILSLRTPISVILERSMNFRVLSNAEFVDSLGGQIVAVSLAALGFGAWALLSSVIARSFFGFLYLVRRADLRLLLPTLDVRPALAHLRSGLAYQLLPLSVIMRDQGMTLIAAGFVGSAALGVWVFVGRLLSIPFALYEILWRVAYPTAARLLERDQLSSKMLEDGMRRVALASAWILALICTGSHSLIPIIFGARWGQAATALLIVSPGILAVTAVSTPALAYLALTGKTRTAAGGVIAHGMTGALILIMPWGGATVTKIAGASGVGSLVETGVLIGALAPTVVRWQRSTVAIILPLFLGCGATSFGIWLGDLNRGWSGGAEGGTLAITACAAFLLVGTVIVFRAELRYGQRLLQRLRSKPNKS